MDAKLIAVLLVLLHQNQFSYSHDATCSSDSAGGVAINIYGCSSDNVTTTNVNVPSVIQELKEKMAKMQKKLDEIPVLDRKFEELQQSYLNLADELEIIKKNECESNPCQNGATCVDQFKSYICICRYPFTGDNCSLAMTCSPEYTLVTNGNVNCDGNSFNDECFFTCNDGYQLIGQSNITCISDGSDDDGTGRWDADAPTCQAVTCSPQPTSIANGNVSCEGNTFGDECTFTCDAGYQLQGDSPVLTCVNDENDQDGTGRWDFAEPTCQAVTCSLADTAITNGSVVCDGNSLGDECRFLCESGHLLNGSSAITCISDGSDDDGSGVWDSNAPTCYVPRLCSDIPAGGASGSYLIQPADDLQPFQVHCNFATTPASTEIGHDSEDETLVDGFEAELSYSRNVVYQLSMYQIEAVVNAATTCKQHINYKCQGSLIFYNGSPSASWYNKDGQRMNYWGGATSSGSCACGETDTCADTSRKCNCDKNDYVWREDGGFLTDKTQLPVTIMKFGDTGNDGMTGFEEQGKHKLGKLICT